MTKLDWFIIVVQAANIVHVADVFFLVKRRCPKAFRQAGFVYSSGNAFCRERRVPDSRGCMWPVWDTLQVPFIWGVLWRWCRLQPARYTLSLTSGTLVFTPQHRLAVIRGSKNFVIKEFVAWQFLN